MSRQPGARWISIATSGLLTLSLLSQAFGQAASVLGVVPEGVVVDGTTLPDLQPGAKLGFRRADGSGAQVGEGSVLDVRDGRALVQLQPGGTVQAGDVAVPCASLTGPGSQADLRVSLQGLKTQLMSAGGGAAEVQAAIGQLESTLDAREAAIRAGSCDVSAQDQQISALSQQLQQLLVASAPVATDATPVSSAASLPPSSADVTAPPPSSAEVSPLPLAPGGLPGGAPGQDAAGASPQSEGLETALQFVQKIFKMAQSMGLMGGNKGSGGQESFSSGSPAADVPAQAGMVPPLDQGTVQGAQPFVPSAPPQPSAPVESTPPSAPAPPVVTTPPSTPSPPVVATPPSTPPPPVVATPPSTPPPPVVSTPPSAPPPTTATPPQSPTPRIVIDAPRLRLPGSDRPGDKPVAGKPSETPGTGDSGKSPERPAGRTPVPGQWWTITPPKQPPVVAGTTPGMPSSSLPRVTVPGSGIKPSENPPAAGTSKPPQAGTSPPLLTLPPGTAGHLGAGSIARSTPPPQRLAVVRGVVRADNGAPVSGAVIAVGGKQVSTNARGQFVMSDVPLGRHFLVASARGFQPGKLALEISSGEIETVTVTLHQARPFSPQTP